ncbi:MAG: hypothetical protein IKH57_26190 [Clostridia bacterium]|nr:hypothetical protein [Clostridia bacterium]
MLKTIPDQGDPHGKRAVRWAGILACCRRMVLAVLLTTLMCASIGGNVIWAEEETAIETDNGGPLISQLARTESADYVNELIRTRVEADMEEGKYLENGLSLVFMIEGAGISDDPIQRLNALCVVVRLNEAGEPVIVYENNESTSIPDHPKETYETMDCATVMDGCYDLYTDNRLDCGVLALERRGMIRVLRFNSKTIKGNRGYVEDADGIQIHVRKERRNTVDDTRKPYSRGCLMVGVGMEEFCAFMNKTLGVEKRIFDAYPYFEPGVDRDQLAGQLILDRSLAVDYLQALYGEIGTQKLLNDGEAEEQPME